MEWSMIITVNILFLTWHIEPTNDEQKDERCIWRQIWLCAIQILGLCDKYQSESEYTMGGWNAKVNWMSFAGVIDTRQSRPPGTF